MVYFTNLAGGQQIPFCIDLILLVHFQQDAEWTPHHEALFRDVLSRAETAEGQLADLQQQIEQARQQSNALLQVQSRG